MKLKYNEGDHTPIIVSGHPVYVDDNGREIAFDAAATIKRNQELESELRSEQIGANFYRSKFIAEKLTLPADIIRASFANAFKLENGKVVAFDKNGNKIYSRTRPGEVADFDEALEVLIDAYPNRESITKKAAATSGNSGGAGNTHAGGRTVPRSAFEALDPGARMAHIRSGGTVIDG